MTKILFTTPVLEHPPRNGSKLRIENSIKALSRIADLIIVSRVPLQEMGSDKAVSFYKRYCRKFVFLNNRTPIYTAKKLMEISRAEDVSVIWLGYGNISYEILHYLTLLRYTKPIVVDTDSVWSRFVLRGLHYRESLEEKLEEFVAGWLKRWEEYWGTTVASVTTSVSDLDAEYYRVFSKKMNSVAVFSNAIDMDIYKEGPENANIIKPCIYLAGTFGPSGPMSPMEEAALWMMEKVLPIVSKVIPDIHFYVVGPGPTQSMRERSTANVTITGAVDSVLPYLCHSDVSVVPLKFESGTRFKIMEAAACRIPIVSTTLGAEGIDVTDRRDILLADTPEDFAKCIIEVVNKPEFGMSLSENCYHLISQNHSISAAANEAENILQSIEIDGNLQLQRYDDHARIIFQNLYSISRTQDSESLLSSALSIFSYLMQKFGDNQAFIEEDELCETIKLIDELNFRVQNTSIERDLGKLRERRSDSKLSTGPELLFKEISEALSSALTRRR